jgi:hypothetical protein
MTPDTAPDYFALLQIVLWLALLIVWPLIVIWALRELGAPVPLSFRAWLAVLVLTVSVKAHKSS